MGTEDDLLNRVVKAVEESASDLRQGLCIAASNIAERIRINMTFSNKEFVFLLTLLKRKKKNPTARKLAARMTTVYEEVSQMFGIGRAKPGLQIKEPDPQEKQAP
jgi:hypothetical protein